MRQKTTFEEAKININKTIFVLKTSFIENFNGSKTILDIECPNGHIIQRSYSNFMQTQTCLQCYRDKTILPYESVKEYFKKEKYVVLSTKEEYKNIRSVIKFICPNGHKYHIKACYFIRDGSRCGLCDPSKKRTFEEAKNEINKTDFVLNTNHVENFNARKTILEITCPNGHIKHTTFAVWKRDKTCKKCGDKKITFPYGQTKEEIEKRGFTLLTSTGEYKNILSKVKIKCPIGHEYIIKANSFIHQHKTDGGTGCPICSGVARHSIEKVKNDIESVVGHKLLSKEYENSKTKLNIECDKGHSFWMTYHAFYSSGQRCPICGTKSHGERIIREYLLKNKYEFGTQVKFDKCRHIHLLPFDFFIPSLNIAIEFDGRQHAGISSRFITTKKEFNGIKKRDGIKTKFCRDNGIKLIRIPHTKIKHINEILDKELSDRQIYIIPHESSMDKHLH